MTGSEWEMGAATYTIGAAAFALLMVALVFHWDRQLRGVLALLACAATAAWTGTVATYYWTGVGRPEVATFLELLRSIGPTSPDSRRRFPSIRWSRIRDPVVVAAHAHDPADRSDRHPFLRRARAAVGGIVWCCLARWGARRGELSAAGGRHGTSRAPPRAPPRGSGARYR